MQFNVFIERFIEDLRKYFEVIQVQDSNMIIQKGSTSIELDLRSVYREFQIAQDYKFVLKNNIDAFQEMLSCYKFKFSRSNIYPFVKNSNFGKNSEIKFISKPFVEGVSIYFVADLGCTFKFLNVNETENSAEIEKMAFENLNKITNSLSKIDQSLDIYSLRWDSDYGATLILADSIKAKINRHIGKKYLFAISDSSTLLVSPISYQYCDMLKHLVFANTGVNPISRNIYACINGKYTIFSKNEQSLSHLQIVK